MHTLAYKAKENEALQHEIEELDARIGDPTEFNSGRSSHTQSNADPRQSNSRQITEPFA